jgi:hypothetical protein
MELLVDALLDLLLKSLSPSAGRFDRLRTSIRVPRQDVEVSPSSTLITNAFARQGPT